MDSAFLGLFSTSCTPSFSGHGYPTQYAANTCRPRSDRFWLLELRVSRHFSTFYEPSVQTMDTQLNALPTLPVRARTLFWLLELRVSRTRTKPLRSGKDEGPARRRWTSATRATYTLFSPSFQPWRPSGGRRWSGRPPQ